MYTTRNDLPAEMRGRLERLLNARLADALDLEAATKQAHWNVKGPHFIALHELFDDVTGNGHTLYVTGFDWNTTDSGLAGALHRQGLRGVPRGGRRRTRRR